MTTAHEALQIGWKLHQARDFRGAEQIYRRVLEVQPDSADAWCFLGILHYDEGHFDQSVAAYEKALDLRPEFPIASSNLSNSLSALGRLDEAERSVRRAIALQPDYATAWTNLGAILVKQGRIHESAEVFERTLQLAPQNEAAHRNLGAVLIRQGRLEEGAAHSDAALRINPRSAEAHRNRAIVRLLLGDFAAGWDEYEWRWQCSDQRLPNFRQPLWNGEPLDGRTLLLHAEQGLGDTLHFVRYAKLARARGGRVILECQPQLASVLRSYRDVDALVPRGGPLPPFDTHLPLMSAPRVFETRLGSIPADVPYLFADPQRSLEWRERLENYGPFRVGLAWQGSRDHHADRQRSVRLAEFAPLAIPGIQFVSLQKGAGSEQCHLPENKLPMVDFGGDVDTRHGAFVDTAAIMGHLDLVITVDTAIAHLAGALGVPVWTLLSNSPDWRWLLDRDDSPWYPTMRLWRQSRPQDWSEPIARMREVLAGLLTDESLAESPARQRQALQLEQQDEPSVRDFEAAIREERLALEQLDAAGRTGDEFVAATRRLLELLRCRDAREHHEEGMPPVDRQGTDAR